MDYAFLRQAGIRHLERMAGEQWTDFNIHDPGITILEQLCYAITDLGYRINYDLKDLLADGTAEPYRSLYSPAEVLTTNPVTLTDLRKVVIDIEGVRNAWIEPVEDMQPALYYNPSDHHLYLEPGLHHVATPLRGVYQVLIEADGSRADLDLVRAVHQRLHECRSLSEDFETPVILSRQPITVQAKIEVGAVEDSDRLLAVIYHALARFMSPTIRFYTLAEMLARGKPIDEIMDGPPLSHGFIDTDELERFNRKQGLQVSDLLQEIMNVDGVSAVEDLRLSDGSTSDHWYLGLSQAGTRSRIPVLDINASLFPKSTIQMVRNGVAIHPNRERVRQIFADLQRADESPLLPESQRDIRLPLGRNRRVGCYRSIQHQFPAAYGIGQLGLPSSAPALRQAQAKQLKAYLLFFDQLLANSFAQLGHVKELFSFYSPKTSTYITQLINDDKLELDEIWVNDTTTRAAHLESIAAGAASVSDAERKHRFLNHLLARFAEEFTDYTQHTTAHSASTDLIEAKIAFLQEYRELSAARSRAFNYLQPTWSAQNISGLEKRISRKLGLVGDGSRDLAVQTSDGAGGLYMLEAILLRPQRDDLIQWTQTSGVAGWQMPVLLELPQRAARQPRSDPFSMRLCFICPDWITRFDHDLVRRIVYEETPAHLDVQVLWLNPKEMRAFEAAYKEWLARIATETGSSTAQRVVAGSSTQSQLTSVKVRAARDRLIDLLQLGNPYPLRDLALGYPPIIAQEQQADIQILNAQIGVCYQLCDADGNPIQGTDSKPIAAERDANQTSDSIILKTPAINLDVTFMILAVRKADAYGALLKPPLETYLRDSVWIKIGINTGLTVNLQPTEGQVCEGLQITVTYGDTISVEVQKSQEGISYYLVRADDERALSQSVRGNKNTIRLVSNPLAEDVEVQVKAYRSEDLSRTARLAAMVSIRVRVNPQLAIDVDPSTPPIVAYAARATLSLPSPQPQVTYDLYQRSLVSADYVTDETPGRLAIPGTGVFVGAPKPLAGSSPDGFVLVGSFQSSSGNMMITTAELLADTLFIVLATKTSTCEQLPLDQVAVVLVRPDPSPQVEALLPVVPAAAEGNIIVRGTEQGVMYQLRRDANSMLINAPGYDYRDRVLETMRIEVDFVAEAPADPDAYQTLVLPTGPVTSTTTYNVLATRLLTGLSVQLAGKATIDIGEANPGI
jgi:hypothetical protein